MRQTVKARNTTQTPVSGEIARLGHLRDRERGFALVENTMIGLYVGFSRRKLSAAPSIKIKPWINRSTLPSAAPGSAAATGLLRSASSRAASWRLVKILIGGELRRSMPAAIL